MRYYHEKIQTDVKLPAKVYLGSSNDTTCHYPLHWHKHLEFNMVLSGKIKGMIGQEPIEVTKGEIFFVNSGELHETDVDCSDEMRAVTILLSYDLIKEYLPNVDEYYFDFTNHPEAAEKVKQIILKCAFYEQEKKEFYELEQSIALHQLCHILLTECKLPREKRRSMPYEQKNQKNVKKAISYMEENFRSELKLNQIASYIGMSPNYFARFFKQSTGETFGEYLCEIRLYYSHQELIETDHSITEIAYNNGFANVKSFIETFKRNYNMTPARYKKMRINKR